jgi:hypothetical protein
LYIGCTFPEISSDWKVALRLYHLVFGICAQLNSLVRRIKQVLTLGDRHLSHRVFNHEVDSCAKGVPLVLKPALICHVISYDFVVNCAVEANSREFVCTRSAQAAPLAVWGNLLIVAQLTKHPAFPRQSKGCFRHGSNRKS